MCCGKKRIIRDDDQNLIHIMRDRDEDEHEVNVIIPRYNILEL